jgi:hypothetical protein
MTIPIKAEGQWEKAEKALLQAARNVSLPHIDKAGKIMKVQAIHQNLEELSIEPRVRYRLPGLKNIIWYCISRCRRANGRAWSRILPGAICISWKEKRVVVVNERRVVMRLLPARHPSGGE